MSKQRVEVAGKLGPAPAIGDAVAGGQVYLALHISDGAILSDVTAGRLSAEEVHTGLREILRAVVSACVENGVEVFLIGGGLLGLVRHGGFIPWDDDLDLAIWASDMPAFAAAMDTLPDHLHVRAKPLKHNPTYQVMDTRTLITGAGAPEDTGIFVDIVPMMHWRSVLSKRLDNISHTLATLDHSPERARWKTLLQRALSASGLPRIADWMTRALHPIFTREDIDCRKEARGAVSGAFGRRWEGVYPHDVVFPLRRADFCGVQVLVPNDPHRFLILRYGKDYMTPLAKDARWKHFDSASEVLKP